MSSFDRQAIPVEIEEAVVDCIMNAWGQYAHALEQLEPQHMAWPHCANVVELARRVRSSGQPVTAETLINATDDRELLDTLVKCSGTTLSFSNMEAIVARIQREAGRRRVFDALHGLLQERPEDPLHRMEALLENERRRQGPAETGDDSLRAWLAGLRQPLDGSRLPTGFAKLDSTVGWLPIGSMSCVGARPSVGKTAFAVNVAVNLRQTGHKVLLVSLEMSERQVQDRLGSLISAVPYGAVNRHELNSSQHEALGSAVEGFAALPGSLVIVDNLYSVDAILARLARERPSLMIVDFLQYVQGPGADTIAELNHAVRRFKQAARVYGCHVMVLSQLNREAERGGRPVMANLKGCGGIEEGSDIICFLHRPGPLGSSATELIVAKNKYGRTGVIRMHFHGDTQRFEEVSA